MAEPPYGIIKAALLNGRVIPFLGAGASFGDRNPSQKPWRFENEGVPKTYTVEYLPTGRELAECLALLAKFPKEEEAKELPAVAQFMKLEGGRNELRLSLQEIFSFEQQPAKIHQYLSEVAAQKPLLIVTTNYDDLMERALKTAECEFDVVVHVTESKKEDEVPTQVLCWRHGEAAPISCLPKNLDIDPNKRSVIYKMHGAIDRTKSGHDQYVITEDDYVNFLSRVKTAIPNVFAELFTTRAFLFLGYGLADWNFRVVLNQVMQRRDDIKSWAIEPLPRELVKKLWGHRNVNVYDGLSLDQFVSGLRNPP